MTPDYDLSNLEAAQVNLWLYLHFDDIYAQIAAGRVAPIFQSCDAVPPEARSALLVLRKTRAEIGKM